MGLWNNKSAEIYIFKSRLKCIHAKYDDGEDEDEDGDEDDGGDDGDDDEDGEDDEDDDGDDDDSLLQPPCQLYSNRRHSSTLPPVQVGACPQIRPMSCHSDYDYISDDDEEDYTCLSQSGWPH